jgi:hypothetical protein
MFEKEIKFIADFNLNKVKSFGSFITFERLLTGSIHPAIIQYISAELDYLISEDRKRILRESVFDYSGPEAAKYFSLIAVEIKKFKEVSFEDLKKLVIHAVSFNLNYLARPKWSLSKLIFNEEQDRSIEEIKLNLNYIYFYDYIKSIFLSYISKRRITTLSVTEFELILNKIDDELFTAQPQKLMDYSLYAMAEFFNLGDVNKTNISLQALELFLKEKNLMDYLFRLRRAVSQDANRKYDIEGIRNIIYSPVPANEHPGNPGEEIPVEEVFKKDEEVPKENENFDFPFADVNNAELPEGVIEEESIAGEKLEIEPEKSDYNVIEAQKVNDKITGQKNEDEILEGKIEEEILNQKTGETSEELKTEEEVSEVKAEKNTDKAEEPGFEEPNLIEHGNEEDLNTDYESLEQYVSPGAELPEKEIVSPEPDVDSLANEDFFSLFSDEIKKVEANDADLKQDADEFKAGIEKKDNADPYLDFEEETENLLRAFKETENEMNSNDIDLFRDSKSLTDKSTADLLNDFHDETGKKDSAGPPPENVNKSNPVKKSVTIKENKGRNILDFISNNDVDKIIFNVFNSDREDFNNTMAKLNECANYDEATEILKSVFLTYRVNPYTKDALTLTNSVANYFT